MADPTRGWWGRKPIHLEVCSIDTNVTACHAGGRSNRWMFVRTTGALDKVTCKRCLRSWVFQQRQEDARART